MDTPASMRASLRWNDDGSRSGLVVIPTAPLLFLKKSGPQPSPSFMDRESCMRREGTPAWMQVVELRLEQAAEDARSCPSKPGISPHRHSGAGRNPVVETSHSRTARMPTHSNDNPTRRPLNPAILSPPDPPSSAACSRRSSTPCIPVGVHPCRRPSLE